MCILGNSIGCQQKELSTETNSSVLLIRGGYFSIAMTREKYAIWRRSEKQEGPDWWYIDQNLSLFLSWNLDEKGQQGLGFLSAIVFIFCTKYAHQNAFFTIFFYFLRKKKGSLPTQYLLLGSIGQVTNTWMSKKHIQK